MNAHVKPRLLIVEDDEGLQRQLRWAYDDYEVLVASDRNAAIDLLRSAEPIGNMHERRGESQIADRRGR